MRKASEAPFPYRSKMIAYMVVINGEIVQITFKEAVAAAESGIKVYGAWPGQWRQDVFELDNIIKVER
jgi:hypothetical protein